VLRDIAERGRDAEGCIKQWFAFVKPNFERFVEPQRKVADIIVPRGIENTVAISKFLIIANYAPDPIGNEPPFRIKQEFQIYVQRRESNHDLLT
jgi:hypothetical protein